MTSACTSSIPTAETGSDSDASRRSSCRRRPGPRRATRGGARSWRRRQPVSRRSPRACRASRRRLRADVSSADLQAARPEAGATAGWARSNASPRRRLRYRSYVPRPPWTSARKTWKAPRPRATAAGSTPSAHNAPTRGSGASSTAAAHSCSGGSNSSVEDPPEVAGTASAAVSIDLRRSRARLPEGGSAVAGSGISDLGSRGCGRAAGVARAPPPSGARASTLASSSASSCPHGRRAVLKKT